MHPDDTSRHGYATGYLGQQPSATTPTPAYPVSGVPVSPPPQYGPREYATAQFGPPPPGFPPVPPRRTKSRKVELIAAAVIVLVAIGIGVAYAVAKSGASPAAAPAATGRQPANVACEHGQLPNGACAGAADPAKTYAEPAVADFKLSLKITDKQCFGSAGCNVGFEVVLVYTGPGVEPSSSWDVTYDITGAEDPYTATMTVTFDGSGQPSEYSQNDGAMVQTKKSSSKLVITVTAVSAGH